MQIKSNRDVSLEVTVPGSPVYVWVDGESWAYRKALGAQIGYNPNQTVILPPGGWMTVGHPRGTSPDTESFSVSDIMVNAEVDTLTCATYGKIITVYTAGTFTASNSCSDGAPSLTTSTTGLRAVVSGTS